MCFISALLWKGKLSTFLVSYCLLFYISVIHFQNKERDKKKNRSDLYSWGDMVQNWKSSSTYLHKCWKALSKYKLQKCRKMFVEKKDKTVVGGLETSMIFLPTLWSMLGKHNNNSRAITALLKLVFLSCFLYATRPMLIWVGDFILSPLYIGELEILYFFHYI